MHPDRAVSLASWNYLKLQSRADYAFSVEDPVQLRALWQWARDRRLPITVLGEGSNVVIHEQVPGLLLRMNNQGIHTKARDHESIQLRVGAGENWHQFVTFCINNGWYGLENLALIPGSVGAAPVQNIGAYGVEVERFIAEVHVFDLQVGEAIQLTHNECQFGYRDSLFKTTARGRYVITAVEFRLSLVDRPDTRYPALKQALGGQKPSASLIFNLVQRIRQEKLPDPESCPNVGSFFKNPIVARPKADALARRWPDMPQYTSSPDAIKLSAAWLLERAGWRGRAFGGVRMSSQHALVLVNESATKASDVLAAARIIQQAMETQYGLCLQIEPDIIGADKH